MLIYLFLSVPTYISPKEEHVAALAFLQQLFILFLKTSDGWKPTTPLKSQWQLFFPFHSFKITVLDWLLQTWNTIFLLKTSCEHAITLMTWELCRNPLGFKWCCLHFRCAGWQLTHTDSKHEIIQLCLSAHIVWLVAIVTVNKALTFHLKKWVNRFNLKYQAPIAFPVSQVVCVCAYVYDRQCWNILNTKLLHPEIDKLNNHSLVTIVMQMQSQWTKKEWDRGRKQNKCWQEQGPALISVNIFLFIKIHSLQDLVPYSLVFHLPAKGNGRYYDRA